MKKYFVAGMLVWAPLAITIWVMTWGLSVLDGVFGSVMLALITVLPQALKPALIGFRELPGVGILIVLTIIFTTGIFAANFAGACRAPARAVQSDDDEQPEVVGRTLAHFLDEKNHRIDSRTIASGLQRRYYAMPYEGRYIWGATAGMLKNLQYILTAG